MAIKSRNEIKIHFETGDIPTESQFWDLIDSYFHKDDDGISLFEYNGNKRLGIGITTPGSRLGLLAEGTGKHLLSFHENIADLYGSWLMSMNQGGTPGFSISEGSHLSSINRFFIKPSDGNVGIGTKTPGEKLEVSGAIKIGDASSNSAATGTIRYNPATGDLEGRVNSGAGDEWKSLTSGGGGTSSQWTSAASDIYYAGGNVGIGITPSETLDVNGGLRIRNAGTPAAVPGTIKFDGNDLFVYAGGSWKSLTGQSQWTGSAGSNIYVSTGNVGIGVTSGISERLEIAGAIKIGDSANADSAEGTIIYESGTFKGKTLGGWEVLVNSVDSVNGQTGDVTLTTNNITENSNLYFTEQRVRQTTLTGFSSTTGTISSSDNILNAINKLSGNTNAKIGGSIPATSGLIPFSDGTFNSVQTNSNLTYLSNALGGYASIGTVLVGTFAANQSFIQGLYPQLTIYSKNSGSKIDLQSTGEIVLTGTISNAGQSYFGANTSPTAFIDIEAGTADTTSLRIRPGTAPSNNLLDGSIWYDGSNLNLRSGSTTKNISSGGTIKGSVAATAGLIPFGSGTADTVTSSSLFSFDSTILSSTVSRLSISGSYQGQLVLNGAATTLNVLASNSDAYITMTGGATNHIIIRPGGSETARFTPSGNFGVGNVTSPGALIDINGSTSSRAPLRLRSGTAPTTANDGDIWYDGTNLKARLNGTTAQLNNTVIAVNGLTGDVVLSTSNITEGTNLYYSDTKVRAVTLGSFTSGAGTIISGDTFLQAIQKLNGNIVSLSTTNIAEGTNLYYTDTKVRAVTLGSFTSGAGTIVSGDTFLQAIQKLNGNIVNVATTALLGTGYAAGAGTVLATDTIKAAFQKLDGNISGKISSQWNGTAGSDLYITTGNLGVGTASPSQKLHIAESTALGLTGLVIQNLFAGKNDSWIVGHLRTNNNPSADAGAFSIQETLSNHTIIERFSIQAGGNIGIGVSSPVEKLELNGAIKIGAASGEAAAQGTIRYNGTAFEGKTSSGWLEFGSSGVNTVNGLSGNVVLSTSNISEGSNLYFDVSRVRSTTLTGFASQSGALAATDTVLQAFQKLEGTKVGGSNINWDNSTGTLTLKDGAGTNATTLQSSSAFLVVSKALSFSTTSNTNHVLSNVGMNQNTVLVATASVAAPFIGLYTMPSSGGDGRILLGTNSSNGTSAINMVGSKSYLGGSTTPTAVLDISGSQGDSPSIRLRSGSAPTGTPSDGSVWYDGTEIVTTTRKNLRIKGNNTNGTIGLSLENNAVGQNSAWAISHFANNTDPTGTDGKLSIQENISGTDFERFVIRKGGNIGIGVSNPAEKIEVNGAITLSLSANTNPAVGTIQYKSGDFVGQTLTGLKSLTGAGIVSSQWTANGSHIFYNSSGNVGIGSTLSNPTEKLELSGAIKIAGSSSDSAAAGTIRYTGSDFEGKKGASWVSLSNVSQWANGSGSEISYLSGNVKVASLLLNPDVLLNVRNLNPPGGGPAYNVFQIGLNNNGTPINIKLYPESALTGADNNDFNSIPGIDITLAGILDNMRTRINQLEARLQNFGLL